MKRYLVVANQTLESPQLVEAIRERMDAGPSTFLLVVPADHSRSDGLVWDEGKVAVETESRLAHAIEYYAGLGAAVKGQVEVSSPVQAVDNVMRGHGSDYFEEIILSTLPAKLSKWLKMDAPSRVQRSTPVPVTHVEAVMAAS